ncbi:hypothetical protein J3R30DRAFT_3589026 [Lentinula aciculospora]|uniref:Secreted protein n=1 Tax=Lentinula aciculospora TaxID=153920 RepID=A0A9W8ZTS3_9AGAR|nr:hypothetical protein J3R30DRAFT_3589026 [Lentinula aciculospora]
MVHTSAILTAMIAAGAASSVVAIPLLATPRMAREVTADPTLPRVNPAKASRHGPLSSGSDPRPPGHPGKSKREVDVLDFDIIDIDKDEEPRWHPHRHYDHPYQHQGEVELEVEVEDSPYGVSIELEEEPYHHRYKPHKYHARPDVEVLPVPVPIPQKHKKFDHPLRMPHKGRWQTIMKDRPTYRDDFAKCNDGFYMFWSTITGQDVKHAMLNIPSIISNHPVTLKQKAELKQLNDELKTRSPVLYQQVFEEYTQWEKSNKRRSISATRFGTGADSASPGPQGSMPGGGNSGAVPFNRRALHRVRSSTPFGAFGADLD